MSHQQIDNLLDFSTPFDAQKLQTFDLVTQHLQSNIPQSVSTPHFMSSKLDVTLTVNNSILDHLR